MIKSKSKKICTFYLIRHGESEWNVIKKRMGQLDSPLTPTGMKQAKKMAKLLKDIKFDALYSSDLGRADQTAQIIAQELELKVKTDPLLRERCFGVFEEKFKHEYKKALAKYSEDILQLGWNHRLDFRLHQSVECDREVTDRILLFLKKTAAKHPGGNVLLVSHSNITRHLLFRLKFVAYNQIPSGGINFLGYIILESDGQTVSVKDTYKVKINSEKK